MISYFPSNLELGSEMLACYAVDLGSTLSVKF